MEEGAKSCPRCAKSPAELIPVPAGMKLALESNGEGGVPFSQVCSNCYGELSGSVSTGLHLRAQEEQKEKNKLQLWKNRVNLIKNARQHMTHKSYSEAAVAYEKYLRIVELVYNKKKGELTPEIFNNSTRSKEMTVIASVYWDLFRIYDTNQRYAERMVAASQKLALFVQYSPIFPDIAKKAEQFLRTAKNPQIVKQFIKTVRGKSGPCFIATAAFSHPYAPEVIVLRRFRDQVLRNSSSGRRFITLYYRHSPPVADWLRAHPTVKPLFRVPLRWFALYLKNQLEKQ